ncbi:MAG: MarR family transcriptional regulator [Rhodospirillaceae bacterium]|nr:MarR family transcriptional regulator [Rhodospirillaceae bacterium]
MEPPRKPKRRQGLAEQTTASPVKASGADAESRITLGLLNAVHEDATASQRSLASELGIALGLTNAYLKRCVRKGWIKISQVPANRYAYYLTPKGFAEKSRLTGGYLRRSFDFYRQARSQCDALLAECGQRRFRRVALYGSGELAEIALLCSLQHKIEIIGIADPDAPAGEFLHLPLVGAVAELEGPEAVILTDVRRPQRAFAVLSAEFPTDRVLVPALLGISRQPPGDDEKATT